MERILVHENQVNVLLKDLEKAVANANEVSAEYGKLNLNAFDLNVLNDLIENGTNNVKVNYLQQLNEDIKKSKIKSPSFANSILSDADNILKPLSAAISKLKSFSFSRLNFHNVFKFSTLKDGIFIITDADLERLKDEFARVYIESEAEAKAFETLKQLSGLYSKLISDVSMYNEPLAKKLKTSFQTMDTFMQVDDDNVDVILENMSYFLVNYNN